MPGTCGGESPTCLQVYLSRSGNRRSSGVRGSRLNLLRDQRADVAISQRKFVDGLQIEPEARAVADVTAQPTRRLRRYSTLAVQDVGDAAGRRLQFQGQAVG